MNSNNRLGLKVAVITTLIVLIGAGIYFGIKHAIESAKKSSIEIASESISQDTDQDGVPDLVEKAYNTDPESADTDNDGTTDGDEVILRRDPTLAGPNDKVQLALGEGLSNLQSTYTNKYLAQLPSDASRQDVLNSDHLEEFIENISDPLLPEVSLSQLLITTESGKEAIEDYLAEISSTHNSSIVAITSAEIESAFRLNYVNQEPEPVATIVRQLEQNVAILKLVETPQEVSKLHQELIAASQALLDNTKLLQGMPKDFVGGLIGAKNISDLGSIFAQIAEEIKLLEVQYKL